jgi:hypothetical protein
MEFGADPNEPDGYSKLLRDAICYEKAGATRTLIQLGANVRWPPEYVSPMDDLMIHISRDFRDQGNHAEIAALLLKAGASLGSFVPGILSSCFRADSTDLVEQLIRREVDLQELLAAAPANSTVAAYLLAKVARDLIYSRLNLQVNKVT